MFDWLVHALGEAIADVREKVVEEGWWGRSLSESAAPTAAEAQDHGWLQWKQTTSIAQTVSIEQTNSIELSISSEQDHGHGH